MRCSGPTVVLADGQQSAGPEVWNCDAEWWIHRPSDGFNAEFADKPHLKATKALRVG
jgi:hypothetical protein